MEKNRKKNIYVKLNHSAVEQKWTEHGKSTAHQLKQQAIKRLWLIIPCIVIWLLSSQHIFLEITSELQSCVRLKQCKGHILYSDSCHPHFFLILALFCSFCLLNSWENWARRWCFCSVSRYKPTHSTAATHHPLERACTLCLPSLHSQTQEDQWGWCVSWHSFAGHQSGRLVWRRSQKARRLEEGRPRTIAVVSKHKCPDTRAFQLWMQHGLIKFAPNTPPVIL